MKKRIVIGGGAVAVLVGGVWVFTLLVHRPSTPKSEVRAGMERAGQTPAGSGQSSQPNQPVESPQAHASEAAVAASSPELSTPAVNEAAAKKVSEVLSALEALYEPAGSLDWNQAKALLAKREQATKELLARLAQLGEGGARAMAAALPQADNLRAKLLLVQGLGQVNDPEAADVLRAVLGHDESFSLRKEVVVALGQRRDAAAEQNLAALLREQSDAQLRFASAQGLAGRESALPALTEQLRQEPTPDVRGELIRSIGLTRSPDAMNALTELAESQSAELLGRKTAIQELARSFGPKALPTLERLLQDSDESVRKSVVGAVARLKTEGAVALLQRTVETDKSPGVSDAAAVALAGLRGLDLKR